MKKVQEKKIKIRIFSSEKRKIGFFIL